MRPTELEEVWRREAPHVLAALVRRYGDFGDAEDAAQEALLAANSSWPEQGVPADPGAWLVRVASRRLVDGRRSAAARARREQGVAAEPVAGSPAADEAAERDADDSLALLLLCAHPALSESSRVALTLRAVAGLTTAQIAAGFLVPEATMAQRISRAKATLRAAGARFPWPSGPDWSERLAAVRQVLYLAFNEGYATSRGSDLTDGSLTAEALRLVRQLQRACPDDHEVAGLLALMLLTEARRAARTDERGDLVPLERQDRNRWDRAAIAEGVGLLERILPVGVVGPFQLQAAITAVHDTAPTWADTDWLEITMLYRMLDRIAPGPAVTLNLAVAVGMAHGPDAGLTVLEPLLDRPDSRREHRPEAVRAHLLEMAGRFGEAASAYAEAARRTASIPEQRYLNARAATARRPSPVPPATDHVSAACR